MDIVIAVGMSMNRPQDWADILKWTKQIVERRTISSVDTRISLVTIGSRINIHFKLDTFTNKNDVLNAIDESLYGFIIGLLYNNSDYFHR